MERHNSQVRGNRTASVTKCSEQGVAARTGLTRSTRTETSATRKGNQAAGKIVGRQTKILISCHVYVYHFSGLRCRINGLLIEFLCSQNLFFQFFFSFYFSSLFFFQFFIATVSRPSDRLSVRKVDVPWAYVWDQFESNYTTNQLRVFTL